jgi:RHS repeat-associated protein
MVATSRDGRQLVRCGFVVREHNGDWWYVVGPGLDEPLLAVKRGFSGMANATQLWLPVVSDDRGQLIAIADSGGQLQGPLIGPQYDAGLWNSSGLTSHAQSFNPRRWATPGGIDTISTFRSRQYDPGTGKWLQEDPMGVAGGVNLYGYNGNDPNSFGDPFGLVSDTLQIDKAAMKDVAQCRARSTLCDNNFTAMEKSSVVYKVQRLDKKDQMLSLKCASGCTSDKIIGNSVMIQYRPSDFGTSQRHIGVKVDGPIVLGHESGHAVTVGPSGTGCIDDTGCAKGVENAIRKQFGPKYGQRP